MPVAVSLWTASTALISCALSLARRSASLAMSSALAPVGGEGLDLDAEVDRHLRPAQREVAGLDDQHDVAGARTGWRAPLPRRRGRSRCTCRVSWSVFRTRFTPAWQACWMARNSSRHEVHDRPVHRPQHAVGDVGRAGIVEELASAGLGIHVGFNAGSGLRKVRGRLGPPALGEASEACDARPLA